MKRHRTWLGLGAFLAVGLLLRASSVFGAPDASWDEDTFILVAQRLAMGELPFTTTFENKPPLFSVLLAVPQVVAPDSRSAVRLMLALVILLTAFAVRAAVRRATDSTVAGHAAGLVLVGVSALAPSGQAWMSQHSANLWLAVLLLTVLPRGDGPGQGSPVLTGVIAGTLVLTRTNYVIPAAALILLSLIWGSASDRLSTTIRILAGAAIPAGLVLVAYTSVGDLVALRAGVLDVLVADGGQGDLSAVLRVPPPWLMSTAGLLVALGAAAWSADRVQKNGPWRSWSAGAVLAVFMGVSVLLHESISSHYLLMFTVPFAVFAGLTTHEVLGAVANRRRLDRPRWRRTGTAMLRVAVPLSLALVLAGPAGLDPARLVSSPGGEEQTLHDDVVSALERLIADRPGSVWALTDHYVYWRTGTLPPHPLVTHPSSLAKPEFWASVPIGDAPRVANHRDAIDLVLEGGPRYVVATEQLDEWYLDRLPSVDRAYLVGHLRERYRIVWRSDDQIVIRELRRGE